MGTYRQPTTEEFKALSAQQRRVINAPRVEFLGLDAAGRPVVQQMAGIPQQLRTWAITRKGDPTNIKEEE